MEKHRIDARVIGVIGSRRMLIDPHGIDFETWSEIYQNQVLRSTRPSDRSMERFLTGNRSGLKRFLR